MRQAHKCRFHRHMKRSKDADADADVDVENNSGCCSQHMRLHGAPFSPLTCHMYAQQPVACWVPPSAFTTAARPLSAVVVYCRC